MTSESVRQAAAEPDLNHRDPEFGRLIRETKERLLSVYRETRNGWIPYLIGGSGTAAVEALVASCVREGPVLVVENGYYSGRIGEILAIHRIPYQSFTVGWEEAWTEDRLAELEGRLRAGRFEALLATHNETTLGRLNPLHRFAAICRETGTRCLVDAMSSFGADPIEFTYLDAVVSSANKCLHGLPGVSFVLLPEATAHEIRDYPRRTYYLSLPLYEGDNPPLTPPVPTLMALRQALRENPGGITERQRDYAVKRSRLQSGLAQRGFGFAVAEEESSVTMVAATIPEGWSFERWFEANYAARFVLYGCKGDLRERYFQASVMGEVSASQIDEWLRVVDRLLSR